HASDEPAAGLPALGFSERARRCGSLEIELQRERVGLHALHGVFARFVERVAEDRDRAFAVSGRMAGGAKAKYPDCPTQRGLTAATKGEPRLLQRSTPCAPVASPGERAYRGAAHRTRWVVDPLPPCRQPDCCRPGSSAAMIPLLLVSAGKEGEGDGAAH